MSDAEPKKPKPRATKAQAEAQRAAAVRLRAEGLTAAEIGSRLGVSPWWAGELVKPVPPNHCRACGGPIEPRKRYHLHCRPSYIEPAGRPSGPPPADLSERRYGLWKVLSYAGARRWLCRCCCGVEKPVAASMLKAGLSSGCQTCRARERWAKVRKQKRRRKTNR